MGRRRLARETALQALYLAETGRMSAQEGLLIVRAGAKLEAEVLAFATALAVGADERRADLDARISRAAENWAIERMAAVDRNLLRLASYELLHCPDTPVGVVIDEALEIAKIYSSADSSRFLNGILDRIKSERDAPAAAPPPAEPRPPAAEPKAAAPKARKRRAPKKP